MQTSGCAAVQLETMETKLSIGGLLEVLGQMAGKFGLGSLRKKQRQLDARLLPLSYFLEFCKSARKPKGRKRIGA